MQKVIIKSALFLIHRSKINYTKHNSEITSYIVKNTLQQKQQYYQNEKRGAKEKR